MGFRMQFQALLATFIFAALASTSGSALHAAWTEGLGWISLILLGFSTASLAVVTLVCMDIWRLKPADSHTLQTLFSQYKMLTMQRFTRPYHAWWLRKLFSDPKKTSEESLLNILRRNADSEYGRRYHFSEIRSREEFVSKHPLTHIDHYQGYIDRIVAGEEKVLYPGKSLYIGTSSGTTKTPKLVPYQDIYQYYGTLVFNTLYYTNNVHLMNLKRSAQFYLASPVKLTSSKIPQGILSMAFVYLSKTPAHSLIPEEFLKLHQEEASYYVQALFTLAEKELQYIKGFSSELLYSYMKFITQYQDSLCHDIERGVVGTTVDIPDDIRESLSAKLRANPGRADELRREFQKGIVGFAKRVWPYLDFVIMSQSSSFKMCADLLRQNYFHGIKTMPQAHASTETICAVYLENQPGGGDLFTLMPYPMFHEFIPLEHIDEDNPKTVGPEELVVGQEYEIVTTTINGFYRYRTADVIKVVGHTYNMPKYELVYRLGQCLNLGIERTSENLIYEAVKEAESSLPKGVLISNFSSIENVHIEAIPGSPIPNGHKGHYVIFIEVTPDNHVDTVKFAEEFDKSLLGMAHMYKSYRDHGTMGNPMIIQTNEGAFDQAKKVLWRGKPHSQFKFPRVLRNQSALKILIDNSRK